MKQEVFTFGRFYAMLRTMPYVSDEVKCEIVKQYTQGRTVHLHEMTRAEYERCCNDMARKIGAQNEYRSRLRASRSAALHLMQKLGVDTSDWPRVDNFCRNSRIAGKDFAMLHSEELDALCKKLRAIARKPRQEKVGSPVKKEQVVIPLELMGMA